MYILNKDELVPLLRAHLPEYLVKHGVCTEGQKKFKCFVHEDTNPSMSLDPKRNNEVVHCFSCNASLDIFGAANKLENLPESGPEWITKTIPILAEQMGLLVQTGEPSPEESHRLKLYKLTQDIADFLELPENRAEAYVNKRKWDCEEMVFGSVSEDAVIARLVELGWTAHDVRASMVLSSSNAKWFGPLWVTTTIRDYIGRPVGFVSRNLSSNGPKYINSCDNELYKKGDHLLGLNTALKSAKHLGLYVVEGPGDLAQLRRLGIRNSVAIAGTSFTADHLLLLKSLGIRTIFFCLDWDQAGQTATARIFKEILKHGQGIGCHVILQPEGDFKDPDEYLVTQDTPDGFLGLKSKTAFEYTISNLPEHLDPADVCIAMIPIIAIEPLSVRRDAMVQQLSESTGIHFQSIISDVNNIRDNKYEERKERLRAAGQKYMRGLEKNPDEASSLLGQHEDDIRNIERDYERDIIGPMYQLAKFETVEDQKIPDTDGNTKTKFIFKYYKNFGDAISGGLQHTSGTLIYFPGRQNSGKTATMIALSVDVLLHDPDAIVMYHFTDDDYATVQPRIKTNICMMTLEPGEKCLTIGQAADPWANITDAATWQTYHRVDALMRELIREEKLVIVDSEEGNTFATLERQLSYIRRKHPETKLLTVCDKRIVTFHG